MQEEQLLLGGPMDGQIISAPAGSPSVLVPSPGAVVNYNSRVYLLDGLAYVVSICANHVPSRNEVTFAIKKSSLRPVEYLPCRASVLP
jgi:hypothetical protein